MLSSLATQVLGDWVHPDSLSDFSARVSTGGAFSEPGPTAGSLDLLLEAQTTDRLHRPAESALKLLLITTEFPPGPGGIGTHASQICSHLAGRGWQVVVLTPQAYAASPEIEAFNAAQPFEVISLPAIPGRARRLVKRGRIISSWVKKLRPEVLLASGDSAVYAGSWYASRHRVTSVAVEHGRKPPRWERPLKRWAFSNVSAVVAVSEFSLQRLLGLGVIPRRQRVIHNGADADRFRRLPAARVLEIKQTLGIGEERILLTVGNMTRRKGQDIVIRALPRILDRIPNALYLVVGLPTRQPQLEALAEELGVQAHVRFVGRVDGERLLDFYNACDVFVMTSRHTPEEFEGYGIGVIEAALCGKPAVVSSSSGLTEAVIHGETGLAVPLEDELATADAVADLLEDEARRRHLGDAAQRRASAEGTWGSVVSHYENLFEELIRSTP